MTSCDPLADIENGLPAIDEGGEGFDKVLMNKVFRPTEFPPMII